MMPCKEVTCQTGYCVASNVGNLYQIIVHDKSCRKGEVFSCKYEEEGHWFLLLEIAAGIKSELEKGATRLISLTVDAAGEEGAEGSGKRETSPLLPKKPLFDSVPNNTRDAAASSKPRPLPLDQIKCNILKGLHRLFLLLFDII